MERIPDILCIGSVLWDLIGHAAGPLGPGDDGPGRILRQPGGVALNVAMALARQGLRPALLSAVGRDPQGEELVARCAGLALETRFLHRPADLPTDRYMAIEAGGQLIAAIADAHTLEAAGSAILEALADGRLARAEAPWRGAAVIDGNLTAALLGELAASPLLGMADLRLVPASPGKAERLAPFLAHPHATLYLNLAEARILGGTDFADAATAAEALARAGAHRVLVTDGPRLVAEAGTACPAALTRTPPVITARRVTGAGDAFMAAHVAAERRGCDPAAALAAAVDAAAAHVSGEPA